MSRVWKTSWALSIGALGLLMGLIIGVPQLVSAAGPPTGTLANQGAPGSSPWPVTGSVGITGPLPTGTNTIGSVGLSASLPSGTNNIGNVGIESGQSIGLGAGTNDIGTVHVAAPTPSTAFALCAVADGSSNCASSLTGLATGTIVNTLSVRCEVAHGQRAGPEFFNGNEYDIAVSLEGDFGGVDVYTGTLTNLGIPVQDGGSWLNIFEDYTASSGNGAHCSLFYVTTP